MTATPTLCNKRLKKLLPIWVCDLSSPAAVPPSWEKLTWTCELTTEKGTKFVPEKAAQCKFDRGHWQAIILCILRLDFDHNIRTFVALAKYLDYSVYFYIHNNSIYIYTVKICVVGISFSPLEHVQHALTRVTSKNAQVPKVSKNILN